MYEIAKIVLAALIFGLGAFMFFCPKLATKKELREDPEAISKTRRSGIMEMIIGIIFAVLVFV